MKTKLLTIILLSILLGSCTQNEMVRNFGGTETINLAVGRELINVTWKQDNMWILTKQANQNHIPETYTFEEKSSYGVWEGKIVVIEHKFEETTNNQIKKESETESKINNFLIDKTRQ